MSNPRPTPQQQPSPPEEPNQVSHPSLHPPPPPVEPPASQSPTSTSTTNINAWSMYRVPFEAGSDQSSFHNSETSDTSLCEFHFPLVSVLGRSRVLMRRRYSVYCVRRMDESDAGGARTISRAKRGGGGARF